MKVNFRRLPAHWTRHPPQLPACLAILRYLGARLMCRTTRKLTLTDAGEAYLLRVSAVRLVQAPPQSGFGARLQIPSPQLH